MGEVFKAHDPVLKRYVAVKTMSSIMSADADLVQRFRREAQSAARLNHPNIVTVFDFGEEHGHFYMAMELLEGTDLKEAMAEHRVGDLPRKIDIMTQVCDGLAYAHAQGVVHRDLKPANLRVLPSGRIKIMDFGLARLDASEITRAGTVMGTPNYMSPEQVRGQRADARSDIFSLGAVFYELITDRKAFSAESMSSVLYKVLEDEPEPMLRITPGLSPALAWLVRKALAKDPAERFQNAVEMKDAISAVREGAASGKFDSTMVSTPDDLAAMKGEGMPTLVRGESSVAGATSTGLLVKGATALDLKTSSSPRTVQGVRTPTLSGRDSTQVEVGAEPEPEMGPERTSRAPLVVAGLVVLVAVAGGTGTWWAMSRRAQVSPPVTSAPDLSREQEQILTEGIVASQVELARVDLDSKHYAEAIRQAESALKLDPGSAEAREIIELARGKLARLEAAAAEARAAFTRGDTDGASRALTVVLSIDPRHPVAGELSAALNQYFRQQAEEARRTSEQARAAMASVPAAAASEGGLVASRLAAEGETLIRNQQFAVATQKFLESRDAFERARRTAEAAARAASRAQGVPSLPATLAARVPPPTLPPVTAPAATLPPQTLPPATVAAAPSHEPAIRKLIADYGRAIEGKDLALFREVKPNLSKDDEKRLADAFKAIKSQQVGITIEAVQVDGGQATVRVSRQDTINGRPVQKVQQTFRLAQTAEGWKIQSIGQ